MKTISIKHPWAFLICSGIKDIENRTWPTKFRGRVLVHASATPHKNWVEKIKVIPGAWNKLSNKQKDYQYGAMIGSVEIVDCIINHESIWAEKTTQILTNNNEVCHEFTIWNWVLANPILFAKPILNVKGKLSFWEYPMTEEEYFNIEKIGNPLKTLIK